MQAVRFCPSTSCCGVSGGGGGVVCGGGGLLSTLLHYISFEIWVDQYRNPKDNTEIIKFALFA